MILILKFSLLFICEFVNGETFRIGYISGSKRLREFPTYNRPGYQISGAIALAVNQINEHHPDGILAGHKLEFEYAETYGLETESMKHTARFCVNNFSAIIGPQETCMHEARLAADFNKLMLSYFCHNALKDGNNSAGGYATFVSVKPPASQVAKPLASLLLKYNWKKVTLLYNSEKSRRLSESVQKQITEQGIQVLHTETWTGTYFVGMPSVLPNPFKKIVQNTQHLTRIYVVIGNIEEHLGFMEAMDQAGLLDTGLYFVVGIYLEQYRSREASKYLNGVFLEKVKPETIKAFQSFFGIIPSPPKTDKVNLDEFTKNVNKFAELPPFSFAWPQDIPRNVRTEAVYLHDAVMQYSIALHECLQNRSQCPDPHNGVSLMKYFVNRTYQSAMGYDVHMDSNGIAQGNYSLLAVRKQESLDGFDRFGLVDIGVFFVGHDYHSDLPVLVLKDGEEVSWAYPFPPADEPRCGFDNEYCPTIWRWVIGLLIPSLVVTFIFSVCYFRMERTEAGIKDWKDLQVERIRNYLCTRDLPPTMVKMFYSSFLDLEALVELQAVTATRGVEVGLFKGEAVAVKRLCWIRCLDLTDDIKQDLKKTKELAHPNLCAFIGACTEPACLVTEYCQRGSLTEALYGHFFPLLCKGFIWSFIVDIVKGMSYLHASVYKTHGSLSPAYLLVDSKFTVKITNFGLIEFRKKFKITSSKPQQRRLWMAPEFLRMTDPPLEGSQSGDVYSFGLILYEIIGREGPFGHTDLTNDEIIKKIRDGDGEALFRPSLSHLLDTTPHYLIQLMRSCWEESPFARPSFPSIMERIKLLKQGMKPTILDNMVHLLQKYATNLENEVAERTMELAEEKRRTECLLYEMLPRPVAEKLINGKTVEAEQFDSVTIFFSDIVGFTSLSAGSTPFEVVEFLNDLYTLFDKMLELYANAYKVETIGDSYMMVSGLPIRNGKRHAGVIADISIHLLSAIKCFRIRHRPSQQLLLRIGIHSGSCVAGIVGLKMPRYCLFGDTVNTASRYESTGKPLRIHCSPQCKTILDSLGGYCFEARGLVPMKGKGEQLTYWLLGHDVDSDKHQLRNIVSMGDIPNAGNQPFLVSIRSPPQAELQRRWSNIKRPPLSQLQLRTAWDGQPVNPSLPEDEKVNNNYPLALPPYKDTKPDGFRCDLSKEAVPLMMSYRKKGVPSNDMAQLMEEKEINNA
ncbi:guanylate cyclase 32E-like [Paramacrobiotus metropolitanus]|uniref:guanylate cyclase 32E-like n=1 Tax=Paramacrobiotus metropolitanus TaxID=2943436 RepID=UPI002445B02C|nr:guanylate cyclase 32E-like [Paramacrobiotus metropolitanus]